MVITRSRHRKAEIAELEAHLGAYLRVASDGQEVVVCDGDRPVERLVPLEPSGEVLVVRRAVRALHDFRLPAPVKRPPGSFAALLAERQSER